MAGEAAAVYGFEESLAQASRLADHLQLPLYKVAVHGFPDGESLVRIDKTADIAILYRSLDSPNEKLVELMLAASVLREAKPAGLVLVTPYLCYMRQDMAFRAGEAVSQRVIGKFLDDQFDGIVTIDPHLHRTRSIGAIFPTANATAISAAPLIAKQLNADRVTSETVLVGPDEESRQWVESVAAPLGLDVLIGEKTRQGDQAVRIELPRVASAQGRPAILIDDVVSTGTTLIECARQLTTAGASGIEALVVHMLARSDDATALRKAGIAKIRSTDSVPHPSNSIFLAPLLADAVREQLR